MSRAVLLRIHQMMRSIGDINKVYNVCEEKRCSPSTTHNSAYMLHSHFSLRTSPHSPYLPSFRATLYIYGTITLSRVHTRMIDVRPYKINSLYSSEDILMKDYNILNNELTLLWYDYLKC